MHGLLDGQLSEDLLITVNDLVLREDKRLPKNVRRESDWLLFDLETPVLGCLHLLKLHRHAADLLVTLLGADLGLHQRVAHVGTLADALWHV